MKYFRVDQFSAGKWVEQYRYQSFSPEMINRQWLITDTDLQTMVADASRFLGELNAFSHLIPDIDFFITMHVAKEAVTSSRIEGTRTHIEEAFLKEGDIHPERRDDWKEVQNYIKAINTAIRGLEKLPISSRLIRDTHKILLTDVRGEGKQPGAFRKSQNWIGGATLKDAVFIPPHHDEVPELMCDLEKFLNNNTIQIPELVRIAIAHYQFETIHPFLDGNGRIGRLLITLYLVSKQLLTKPALYLSDFFERNKILYYDNLMAARLKNNLNQWLKFFMVGVIETAKKSIGTFQSIIAIKQACEEKIMKNTGKRAKNSIALMTELYRKPIVTAQDITRLISVSLPTANTLLRDLCALHILHELTGYKRNRIFAFSEYLSLFE